MTENLEKKGGVGFKDELPPPPPIPPKIKDLNDRLRTAELGAAEAENVPPPEEPPHKNIDE